MDRKRKFLFPWPQNGAMLMAYENSKKKKKMGGVTFFARACISFKGRGQAPRNGKSMVSNGCKKFNIYSVIL
jgi:hypothetical protein